MTRSFSPSAGIATGSLRVNDTATVPLRGEVAASTALRWRLE